ncbi:MAG: hypothetical protein JST31_06805 [Actinobacteria bacterium]|nr:hypothetical protein [Actinomycetota bacterium]
MALAAISSFRDLVEVAVTAVSILGGFMAFCSGFESSLSVRAQDAPDRAAHRVNCGLAYGFNFGLPAAGLVAAILVLF